MKLVTLSEDFYTAHADCPEILKKHNRPYVCVLVKTGSRTYGIPLRHHIRHPYGYHTIGEQGLDYSKAVVIEEGDTTDVQPWIESKEWNIIKANYERISFEFRKYLKMYDRALSHPDNPRSKRILEFSTLKYF